MTSPTPFITEWFATLDSTTPKRVLDLIAPDFEMSIVFSKGEGQTAEFWGDRAGLVGYLDQRENNTLVHHLRSSATVGDTELALGFVTRAGEFEASFNVSALLEPATRTCRRLLICRTPAMKFPVD
jgi:hypothetical protein